MAGNIACTLLCPASNEIAGETAKPFRDTALQFLGQLERIVDKELDKADEIVENRLNQLQSIIADTDDRINKDLNKIDEILDDALTQIQQLENDLFEDIAKVFEEIYGVIDQTECAAMGQQFNIQLVLERVLNSASERVDIGKKLNNLFLPRDWRTDTTVLQPTDYYTKVTEDLLEKVNNIEGSTPVEEILNTYVNLMYNARNMQCLFRGTQAAEPSIMDFLSYEKSFSIWWKNL